MFRATFYDYKPCFLNTDEIINPFLVLNKTYQDLLSAELIIDDCWDLWTAAFKKNYWTTHESPRILYEKFLRLARLLDAGFLVSKIKLSYLTIDRTFKEGYNPRNKCNENSTSGELIEAYKVIANYYNKSSRFDLGFDLYNAFYQGLMPTSLDFEDLLKESIYSSFQKINQLIISLFVIYKFEDGKIISEKDKVRLEELSKVGLDNDITQFNYYDNINNIFEPFDKKQFFSIIEFLKSTSCSNFFWKNNGNPANVLYYMEELQFVMEILWAFIKGLDDINSEKWEIPKKCKKQTKYLSKEALKNPFKFLSEEFAKRDLSNRRKDIEEWRLATLDNNWHNEDEHKDIQDFLFRLIEIADLLEYRPINY